MRKRLALVVSMTLGIAMCTSARAQNVRQGGENRNVGNQQTIRGVIAGVTAIGETEFNPRTNRLEGVEASSLEIVGSPIGEGEHHDRVAENSRNQTGDNKNESEHNGTRHRDNMYVIWLTPQTRLTLASEHDGRHEASKREQNAAQPITFEDLQLGDRVEVTFDQNQVANARGARTNANSPANQKHGRNRVYYGDAVSIKVLPARSHHEERSSEHERSSSRERSSSNHER